MRPGAPKPELATNHRNGTSGQAVLTDDGPVPMEVPRDRAGSVEPQLIGNTSGASPASMTPSSRCTRVGERFDALRVKIRDEAVVRSKAVYLALAVLPDGSRDILGIWIEQTEGATCWMKVVTDLKTRGGQDIPSADAAPAALDDFERRPWGRKFPTVVASWRRAWTQGIPFFAFPREIRRLISTTNALESVHAQLRTIIETRGHCPNDDAATKLLWLALRNLTAQWKRTAYAWHAAMNQFAILYGDRLTVATT
jgi:transposase-like protein